MSWLRRMKWSADYDDRIAGIAGGIKWALKEVYVFLGDDKARYCNPSLRHLSLVLITIVSCTGSTYLIFETQRGSDFTIRPRRPGDASPGHVCLCC
jgi:hypothetical protein